MHAVSVEWGGHNEHNRLASLRRRLSIRGRGLGRFLCTHNKTSGAVGVYCLHVLYAPVLPSFQRCIPDYMPGLISCLVHRWNKRKFAGAWAKPEAIGITKDYLRDLAPHFACCMDNHREISDNRLNVRGVAGEELLDDTCSIVFGVTGEGAGDLRTTLAEENFECLPKNEEPQFHGNNIWEWLNRLEKGVEKEGRFPFEEDVDAHIPPTWYRICGIP